MPSQIFGSLYALVAEGETYLRAEILLATNPVTPGQTLAYGDITQPTVAGYAAMRAATLEELFPHPQIVPGKAAIMRSRQINLLNVDVAAAQITAVVLVVWKDSGTPVVVALVPAPQTWSPGMRIGGRLRLTTNIYGEP